VRAAVTRGWSNGPVEGQINRLKMLKRTMYGRAGLDLLSCRFLTDRPSASSSRCSGLQSSAAGLAIIANFGSRSVRLSGPSGSGSVILGSR
jgi:hypothetical protein